MASTTLDPDVTRRDDAPYWAAAFVLALRAGDKTRARAARKHLCRLGLRMSIATQRTTKAVRRVR